MSKKNRIFLSIVSSFMLGVIALGLWSRLGPLSPSVTQALASSSSAQRLEEDEGPMADHPYEALAWRNLSLVDENGFIPADGLINANQQIKAMRAQQEAASKKAITSNGWTWLGPGNIGGRVRSVVIHPTNTNIMWAGSVTGGIWKTTNGGASWAIMDDFMTNMAVSTMVIDPTNPEVLYAGTGETGWGGSEYAEPVGGGVFKTTNGGTTWTQLASTNTYEWYFVNRLAISPANPLILLAATDSGTWKSIDGGTSWVKAVTGSTRPGDVNFNPVDGTKAISAARSENAYYSTNSGDSWTAATFTSIDSGAGRVEVAYAPSNPSIVYASVEINGGEVWKSTDGGVTYSRVNTGQNFGANGWNSPLWVDPTNPNILIVGGIDLFRSTDGGATLTQISVWQDAPSSAHADHHWIVEQPGFNGTSNTTVLFGNDGGVYRADNVYTVVGTSGWTELNNNLGITQFYGAAGNPTTGKIVGGTQDNGTLVYTPAGGTEGWTTTFGGDGGWSAADPVDDNYLYGEYIYAQVHRSNNGGVFSEDIWGQYWDGFAYQYKSAPYTITEAKNSQANFIAPLVLDPNNSNRLLVGAESLWRTNDVKAPNTSTTGPAWYVIKAPTTGNSNISAIVVAPGNSDIIWVGHNNGDVYVTTNGTSATPTWAQVDSNSPGLPDRYVTRIAVDKNNTSKAYVTFGGFNPDNVWVTTNGGSTWTDSAGSGLTGLPYLPVRSLVIHPFNSNWIYIGTELGIFTSVDGGATWDVSHNGPTNTPVDELFWMDTKLVATTYGRGLFQQETATFSDVPGAYWSWSWIERLYAAGITGGCATSPSLAYCPDSSVTRAQMAVFLLKGMHGSSYTPPAVGGSTGFGDVAADYWAAAWIKQLAAEGITSGCGAGNYCPETIVTRAQMSIFLLKAKHGSSYSPPAATGDFTDVPVGYWADKWIEQLAVEGITGGCGVGVYCPDSPVTRAQMAVFLVKTFTLP
ncbi:MAG: S-layer homology domain-containing protein [Anaerolineales bacterium]|uniref:S-layer homology domain-containing protein n=1 Tax=Candidatus Villigracilis proximus TaxID=3140683 RepID=UPI0031357EAA|nr:S-layer homology domain-containing protein [Anaerolineales bacterium]